MYCLYIPVDFEGKEIELTGYLKLNNVANGPIGFMVRTDGDGGVIGFNSLQKENIQGTIDWQRYSVKLPLTSLVKKIYIAALLSGSGQLWADDFQVLIDGKEISEAKPLVMKKFNADKDVEFDDGVSRISSIKLSPSKIEDLALLGKVWGFLKYYHPKIAEGEYNWDYELLRVMPKIVSSQSSRETNSALSD
ncbi:MAG: hypothetical protein WDN75_02785 [Bacteroidota bacterium]